MVLIATVPDHCLSFAFGLQLSFFSYVFMFFVVFFFFKFICTNVALCDIVHAMVTVFRLL